MINRTIIDEFFNAGKNLTILNGKKPIASIWQNKYFSKEVIYNHKGNIGWVLGDNDFVVDVDPRNDGDKSFEKLQKDLGISLKPTVYTAQGGFHVYLTMPFECEGKKLCKTLKQYAGIDFLTKGSQCVIPSSKTEHGEYSFANDEQKFTQEICPDALVDLLCHDNQLTTGSKNSELGDFEGFIGLTSSTWSQEQVGALLAKLDPSTDYDSWLHVGMALKNWDAIEGLALWDKWSQGCTEKYKQGDCAYKWKGFEVDGGITLGSLVYMAQEVDYHQEAQLVKSYLEKIKLATDQKTLEFDLPREIRKQTFSEISKQQLIKAFQSRLKEITNANLPIASVRSLLIGSKVHGDTERYNEPSEWCKDWVYVVSTGKFYNMRTLKPHSDKSFNIVCGNLVPSSENGYKVSATKYVSDWGLVEHADIVVYMPSAKNRFIYVGEQNALNIFNPKSLPKTAESFSEAGLEAIELIKKHILLIFGTSERAHIFEQWLAHQVQYSGELLKWAPLIQSIQGTGKSFFTKLLRFVLGDSNVGVVMPSQVMKDFNGWAVGSIVNVLEELRVVGHSRHDAANALKPLITDEMIQINDKGISQFTTFNTINYICFTNFQDALPMEANDRRWWVIFAPVSTMAEFPDLVGESVADYFEKLYHALENHKSEVRKWLLEYPISKEFKHTTQAPMTKEKRMMIDMEEQNIIGLMEAKDAIEQGHIYFDDQVVSSSHLFAELQFHYGLPNIQAKQKNNILQKLGFKPILQPIKIQGINRRMWTKKTMSNDEIRQYIQKKVLENKLDDI